MKVRVRVLCPIHIGSGEEISPTEYFIDREKGMFNRLNLDSLFQDRQFRLFRDNFLRDAARSRSISQIINDGSLLKRHILYSLPISPQAREIITKPCNVKMFMKSAGRAYLPGSSLKGSILSAFLWYVLKEKYEQNKTKIEPLIKARKYEHQRAYDDLLNLAFEIAFPHNFRMEKAKFTHWLDVSDSDFRLPAQCLQISLVEVKGAQKGGQIPIFYGTLKEGTVFEMEMKATPKTLANNFSETKLLQVTHEFYSRVANKDGVNIESDRYLIRLGQGSTAFSTSLLLLAEEIQIRDYRLRPPRTRKRIDEHRPMGFAQISRA